MAKRPLPKEENIYETECPILYAMDLIGQKWKLPILWYIADAENQTLRYKELERKVVCIILIAAQCFVFPYDAENEFIRILQAVEGIAVFTMLIVLVYRILFDLCGAKADKIRA